MLKSIDFLDYDTTLKLTYNNQLQIDYIKKEVGRNLSKQKTHIISDAHNKVYCNEIVSIISEKLKEVNQDFCLVVCIIFRKAFLIEGNKDEVKLKVRSIVEKVEKDPPYKWFTKIRPEIAENHVIIIDELKRIISNANKYNLDLKFEYLYDYEINTFNVSMNVQNYDENKSIFFTIKKNSICVHSSESYMDEITYPLNDPECIEKAASTIIKQCNII